MSLERLIGRKLRVWDVLELQDLIDRLAEERAVPRLTSMGDPLEGAMSSVPGLALASTGTSSLALLGDALSMLPWNRTASPWEREELPARKGLAGIHAATDTTPIVLTV